MTSRRERLPRRLRCHLWLAARLLPVRAKRRSIERLLVEATPPEGFAPYRGVAAQPIVDAVRATLARPWRMRGRRCLREGLVAFRFLRLAGHPAVLHFAVASRSPADRLSAHCWVTLDGAAVLDGPRDDMVPLMRWDGEARFAERDG
jgi:hypothetical protein